MTDKNFKWRLNDESITTRTRYDLEADHWRRAIKSVELNHRPTSIKADLHAIGLFVSLVFSLLTLVILLLIDFIKWLRS